MTQSSKKSIVAFKVTKDTRINKDITYIYVKEDKGDKTSSNGFLT